MKIVAFPERTVVYAKDQPEYLPLPAYVTGNAEGEIVCCWALSWRDRIKILFTGQVWHSILTFRQPLQPQLLSVDKPAMLPRSAQPAGVTPC